MPYRVVLLRHGESTWNRKNLFTGWTDVGLTERGVEEAREAGRLLVAEQMSFEVVHTSVMRRALETTFHVLDVMDLLGIPVREDWRLNERHYGGLQGLDKRETAAQHGAEQVLLWRRSYAVRPPALDPDDERHPRHDPSYRKLPPEVLPASESLADVVERVVPCWKETIVPDIAEGRRVLISAHGNSLRALVKYLDAVPEDEITELNIPTGIPLVYELDEDLRPARRRYLGDEAAAQAAAEAVARQAG